MSYKEEALLIAEKYDAFLPMQLIHLAECDNIPLDEFEDWIISFKLQHPNLFFSDTVIELDEEAALLIAEKHDAFCPQQLVNMARGKIASDQFETWVVAIKPYEPGLFRNSVHAKDSTGR